MAKQLLHVEVQGTFHRWGFNFMGDPKHLADWRADGLIVDEVCNTIPAWVVDLGLTRFWCFGQDLFHLRIFHR